MSGSNQPSAVLLMLDLSLVLILVFSLFFLLEPGRKVIRPTGAWFSFLIRVLLWIGLALDHLLLFFHLDLLDESMEVLLSFLIVAFLLYSIVGRYRIQRAQQLYQADLQARIHHLEILRQHEGW